MVHNKKALSVRRAARNDLIKSTFLEKLEVLPLVLGKLQIDYTTLLNTKEKLKKRSRIKTSHSTFNNINSKSVLTKFVDKFVCLQQNDRKPCFEF